MSKSFPEAFRPIQMVGKLHIMISQGAAIYKQSSLAFSFELIF